MFRLLNILSILLCATILSAQQSAAANLEIKSAQGYYIYPIEGVAGVLSANFGDMRPNHLHSGVDIKSNGVSGKRIVAAADGYVSRLSLSPVGYGLSIYICHPNGTTTQYGHLSKFRDDIAEYVESERYRLQQHSVNIFLTEHQFPVKQGELIGYSGNSGSSSGPHLHYEVRESKEQRPLNPIAIGAIGSKERLKPLFTTLYYIESETINGVIHPNVTSQYELVRSGDGQYSIKGGRDIWVGREGHFVVAVSDKKEGSNNNFGLHRLEGYKNDKLFYKYRVDDFLFANTRYSNALSFYPLQKKSSIEHYRMRRQEGLPESLFLETSDNGMIRTKVGERSSILIVAMDELGNRSTLKFNIRGKDNKDCFKTKNRGTSRIARVKSNSTFKDQGIEVVIPKGALYEATPYRMKRTQSSPKPMKGVSGVKVYSPEFSVLSYNTPLHRAMEIKISAKIPESLVEQSVMVYVNERGSQSAVKGSYINGQYVASAREAGRFFVACDTVAPTITSDTKPNSDIGDRESISFIVKDNFSGVASYEATLNGEWIALDMSAQRLTHTFRGEAKGEKQVLELRVKDLVENESVFTISFIR